MADGPRRAGGPAARMRRTAFRSRPRASFDRGCAARWNRRPAGPPGENAMARNPYLKSRHYSTSGTARATLSAVTAGTCGQLATNVPPRCLSHPSDGGVQTKISDQMQLSVSFAFGFSDPGDARLEFV